jgi:phosphatidylethanolamine-binding protein (PEBP) family uncharacterized protein
MKFKIKKSFRRKRRNTRIYTRKHKKSGGTNDFKVQYGQTVVVNGPILTKSETQSAPNISFPHTEKLYTLVMWDPDAPNPSYVHWIVTNIKSSNNIGPNNEVLPYTGPNPPSGIHRYYFGLFEQLQNIYPEKPERSRFNIDTFIKNNNLIKINDVFIKVSA